MDQQEHDLIKRLREEANEVKKCFTNFSFAAITFSSAVFAAIVSTVDKFNEVSFAAIPVVALLMVVCRIGIYKYSTANRNYGYELHQARLKSFGPEISGSIMAEIKKIEWEEALRSWRVVQTAIFRALYRVPENTNLRLFKFIDPRLYKLKNSIEKDNYEYKKVINGQNKDQWKCITKYPWFMPHLLAWDKDEKYSSYHAGTYLQNMITILQLMQVFLIMPMAYLVIAKQDSTWWLYFITVVLMLVLIHLRSIRMKRRRLLLENEILSIHSCGIVWQAVALAHVLARKECNGFCEHYTELLMVQCQEIKSRFFDIHQWFNEKMGIPTDCTIPDLKASAIIP